ncbi:hypothetical protein BS47DRAFT_387777 [Hydnum rufescens UP504]|uniref:C3H1-type domain-containing protein n=1 Tax=Hydnum rufescens UP504 TaxID=1448309 RepID=A0A9P6AJS8_9AGAM|nr:hypothetical protein BS47DRAFT_387777 [Hydnum rufescens UP504]
MSSPSSGPSQKWSLNHGKGSRTKQCERDALGHCPFGNECWFIHSPKGPISAVLYSGRQMAPDETSPAPVAKYEPPHRKTIKSSVDSITAPRNLSGGTSSPISVQSQVVLPHPVSSTAFISAQVGNSGLSIVKQGWRVSDLTRALVSGSVKPKCLASDKPCFHFARSGMCPKGDQCVFKHDSTTLPPNFVKFFDPKLHPSYKTKPCYPFMFGQCLKGDDCTFKHEAPPPHEVSPIIPADPVPLPPNYRTSECKWFNSPGGCWYGNSCKFKHTPASSAPANAVEETTHPFYRTRPCAFYQLGTCPKGSSCNYIHDISEKPNSITTTTGEVLVLSPIQDTVEFPSGSPEISTAKKFETSDVVPEHNQKDEEHEFSSGHLRMASTSSSTTAVELSPMQTSKTEVFDNEFNDADDDIVVYTPPQGFSVNVHDIEVDLLEP